MAVDFRSQSKEIEMSYELYDWGGEPIYVAGDGMALNAARLTPLGTIDTNSDDFTHLLTVTAEWARQFRTQPLLLWHSGGYSIIDSNPLRVVWTDLWVPLSVPIESLTDISLPFGVERPPFDPAAFN